MNKSEIETLIYETFDDLMSQSENLTLEKSPSCELIGEGSALDSLGIVNFLVALEQKLSAKASQNIVIADQELVMGADKPLRTVDSLVSYLAKKLS